MGRKRKSNKDLPQRVYKKHGAYYLVTSENKWIKLGNTKSEMYKALAELDVRPTGAFTVESLWSDFCQDRLPDLAHSTQRGYKKAAKMFLKTFGHMLPGEIKSSDIAKYLLVRGRKAKTCANAEIQILSVMYTYAVSLGHVEFNPCMRVKRHKIGPRERYVEDWEFDEFKSVCDEFMGAYLELKYLTGLRQTDMLLLTMANIKDEGLYVRPNKTQNSTGETRIFVWTPDLRAAVERIENLPRPKFSLHFFVKKNGTPLIDEEFNIAGFGYRWGKIMDKALKETKLSTRFQEKDIRAKTATDADDDGQDATSILGHEDSRTTRIYLRGKKIKRVKPLERKVSNTGGSGESSN